MSPNQIIESNIRSCSLTIIIPHHNIPELLQRCLDSIPERDDIQVLVIDDNSDESYVDFEMFPGRNRNNVETFFTSEGKGAGSARNVGLKHAEGDWLLFADADDFFVDGFYDIVSNYFNSAHDMIIFKAESVNSDTLEPSGRNRCLNSLVDRAQAGDNPVEASLSFQAPWCRLIRRSFVVNNQIWFEEVLSGNDVMFTTKASCLAGSIGFSDKIIYINTERRGSLWDSRKQDPTNYLTRLKVQIERNKYVATYGYRKRLILVNIMGALDLGIPTFIKAVAISILRRSFFDGFGCYLKAKFTVN